MNKFKQAAYFVIFSLIVISCTDKEKQNKNQSLTFVFYNVENLFDTIDEPGKEDEEFTPEGEKQWTIERYHKKLDNLSQVLSSVNGNELPDVIGLCEVENEKVIGDLINTNNLENGDYRIIHYESPDVRGIDCALLYNPDKFEVLDHFPIHIEFKDESDYKTRDILYIKAKSNNDEEVFHIFVNHWPSRVGGEEQTESDRVEVASLLRSKVDSLFGLDPHVNIVIMGDMNDEPANKSLHEILGADIPGSVDADLINLMFPDDMQDKGSYYYQEDWNMLDNLIISTSLLDEEGFRCIEKKGFVFYEEWMEYTNGEGIRTPDRTYGGVNYYGGVSDHFPVYFTLEL